MIVTIDLVKDLLLFVHCIRPPSASSQVTSHPSLSLLPFSSHRLSFLSYLRRGRWWLVSFPSCAWSCHSRKISSSWRCPNLPSAIEGSEHWSIHRSQSEGTIRVQVLVWSLGCSRKGYWWLLLIDLIPTTIPIHIIISTQPCTSLSPSNHDPPLPPLFTLVSFLSLLFL